MEDRGLQFSILHSRSSIGAIPWPRIYRPASADLINPLWSNSRTKRLSAKPANCSIIQRASCELEGFLLK